ncbi:MAG TPA: hypothetical protein V6D26_11220 [Stenomitos sp.]
MNEDLREAFVVAALETFKKLSECPELKNYKIYCEPGKSLRRKLQKRAAIGGTSTPTTGVSSVPFRWVLVVSAQTSARQSVLKVRGYRQS